MAKITYICPYCFSEHPIHDVLFRCKNRRCKWVPDKELAAYLGRQVEIKQYCFSPPPTRKVRMPVQGMCPECGEATNTRICPSCHNNLPGGIETNKECIISIIGARDSGKSSFVAVLIKELKKRIVGGFGGAISFMDQESYEEYEERFGRYIYPSKPGVVPRRLPQTKSNLLGNTMVGVNRPILCDIRLLRKKWGKEETIPYTFVFFDAAGEDFDDEGVMFTVSKYISQSEGIIFLLDPMHLQKVRKSLSEEVIKGASTIELGSVSPSEEIILRVARLIRAKKGMPDKERIHIPVAAAFSKLDVLQPLLPPGSVLSKQSPHVRCGKFVREDAFWVGEDMKALLWEWGEQEFLRHLQLNYDNYGLFAFSALGHSPDEEGKIEVPRPIRIEDALLWILQENNIIEAIEEV